MMYHLFELMILLKISQSSAYKNKLTYSLNMPRYLDIDEILADDERLTCRMMQESADLGHLNSNVNSVDLPRDAKVEIPMWLAQVFFEVFVTVFSFQSLF